MILAPQSSDSSTSFNLAIACGACPTTHPFAMEALGGFLAALLFNFLFLCSSSAQDLQTGISSWLLMWLFGDKMCLFNSGCEPCAVPRVEQGKCFSSTCCPSSDLLLCTTLQKWSRPHVHATVDKWDCHHMHSTVPDAVDLHHLPQHRNPNPLQSLAESAVFRLLLEVATF